MAHVHTHTETGRPEPPAEVAPVTAAMHRPEPPGPDRAQPRAAGETTPGGDCFSIPIPTTCADCGACCHSSSQPAIYLLLATRPAFAATWHDKPDVPRAAAMPPEAWDTVCQADPRVMRCCWLDGGNRCRWHEHRPEACRKFAIGCDECLAIRRQFKIGDSIGGMTTSVQFATITGGAG